MTRFPISGRRLIAAAFVLFTCYRPVPAEADPPDDAVLLDGISVLAGGRPADDAAAVPILLSEVALEGEFLQLSRFGPMGSNRVVDEALRKQARKQALLIRVLANRAKRLEEVVDPSQVLSLEQKLTGLAGGEYAMERLLQRYGVSRDYLHQWAKNALLAVAQVRYAEEQTDGPGKAALEKWLAGIVAVDQIRIFR